MLIRDKIYLVPELDFPLNFYKNIGLLKKYYHLVKFKDASENKFCASFGKT